MGVKVVEAASGQQALEYLEANERDVNKVDFSAALLNSQMPVMDGAALGKAMQADARFSHIPLIMMSSATEKTVSRPVDESGFSGYFDKPIEPSSLYDALSLLTNSGNRAEYAKNIPTLTEDSIVEHKLNQFRILLVEDNPINRLIARKMLQATGVNCDVADNGALALDAIQRAHNSTPFDLILMDCQMPVLDGFEATAAIRRGDPASSNPSIPIIALTANVMEGDREKCLAAGMDDYLPKPVNVTDMLACIERWLPGFTSAAQKHANTLPD